jgi:hypothetical protein
MGRPGLRIQLPIRVVLYTVDQLSSILSIPEDELLTKYLYFQDFSIGVQGRRMLARNIEIDSQSKPRWRVAETELVRYLVSRGFTIEGYRM